MRQDRIRPLSHNVCYRKLPSREVFYLFGWNFHSDVSNYYIRLFRDLSTGTYFYTVRDLRCTLSRRVYSVGFSCVENALLDIVSFVSSYTNDYSIINSILKFKERV